MQLIVHRGGIGPSSRIQIQIALLRHVQEVDDQHVERQVAIAVSLGNGHELVLRGIDRLALDVAVCCFRQHVGDTGELAIALVDLIAVVARNHKEGDTVTHLG